MPENNLFDMKKRIKAAGQTRKITRTMELIASSRLQRGKALLTTFEEWLMYMHKAARVLPDSYYEPQTHLRGDVKKAYIVFGGSKGLSGPYSPNLLQYAKPIVDGYLCFALGSASEAFFADAHSLPGDQPPSMEYAITVTRTVKDVYERREADEVYMIYMRGLNPVTERLFPLTRREEYNKMIIVEPSAQALFPVLFEEYAASIVFEAHLQAFIAEQIARVTAMDNATQNADEIIEDLQATYNRVRQSSITQEILTVSNALRGD